MTRATTLRTLPRRTPASPHVLSAIVTQQVTSPVLLRGTHGSLNPQGCSIGLIGQLTWLAGLVLAHLTSCAFLNMNGNSVQVVWRFMTVLGATSETTMAHAHTPSITTRATLEYISASGLV